jgi:DNA-binding transcriptional regulator YiaG
MSTGGAKPDSESVGFPELTSLGKRIEVLRIGRGLSKQRLARFAGTSRQQRSRWTQPYWRAVLLL